MLADAGHVAQQVEVFLEGRFAATDALHGHLYR